MKAFGMAINDQIKERYVRDRCSNMRIMMLSRTSAMNRFGNRLIMEEGRFTARIFIRKVVGIRGSDTEK